MIATLLPAAWREASYRQRFLSNTSENLFMGSFGSFAEAEAAVPPSKRVGYDSPGAEELYAPQLLTRDYPALFWIGQSIKEGMRTVFDLGGHVGIKYYAFKRALRDPPELHWKVCDVPSIVKAGREIAEKRGCSDRLTFCTDFREASGHDVLLVSGCLQYLPTDLGEILASLPVKPRRIVLNTTALHPERTMYTLNSIIVAVCPYRIQHADEMAKQLADAGYRRQDNWRNDDLRLEVPFVPGGDKPYYAGGCWDRRPDA